MLRALMPLLLVSVLSACAPGLDASDALLIELTQPRARHCGHCGWIESKRPIVPVLVDPLAATVYEYTLRMPDGSSSLFLETLPAGWRLGERVGVIQGISPPPG
jgi:hypothetical protein